MKYIKIFEEFNSKSEVDRICKKYKIKNYTINDDFSIDVNGSVILRRLELKELPLTFRNVTGSFDCSNNYLTSLKGSPIECDSFLCNHNNLTTLDGAPKKTNGCFNCSHNNLTNLNFSPLYVDHYFSCGKNDLTSLEGCPEYIGWSFTASVNIRLNSFKYLTDNIQTQIDVANTNIYSFEYFPEIKTKLMLFFPDGLENVFRTFNRNYDLIEAFNDYNIIKSPISEDSKPRLKLSNLNKFLIDMNFEENDGEILKQFYDLK